VDEEGANLGGVASWIEQVVVTVGPLVGTVESFAFAPAATGDNGRGSWRFRRAMLDNKISTIGNKLGIDAENRGERALSLRRSVVVSLKLTDGSVDEGAKDREVCWYGGADAEIRLHGDPQD
jgi:hypothetical protein